LPEQIPLTRDMGRLFLDQVRRLPKETQHLLTIVACDDTGSLEAVLRAAERSGIGADALAPAEEAGLVAILDARIEPRHPLVRSAVHEGATLSERRAAHLALAEVVEFDQRAWHRAAAALGPDDEVAAELERTAERARRRGGCSVAAGALQRAAQLSTTQAEEGRRLVAAARAAWDAAEPARALAMLDRAAPLVDDGWLLAEMSHVRGQIGWRCGDMITASAFLLEGAQHVAPFDARKALEMLFDAGMAARDIGDFGRLAEACRRVAALPASDDPDDVFLADLLATVGGMTVGRSSDEASQVPDLVSRARGYEQPRWLMWAAVGAQATGDTDAAMELLQRAGVIARRNGDVDNLIFSLVGQTIGTLLVGKRGARAESNEGLSLAREAGLTNAVSLLLAALAWGAAVEGDAEACRAHAAEACTSAQAHGFAMANSIAEWGMGMLDLALGRPEDAATRLSALGVPQVGVNHPFVAVGSAGDLIEAAIRSGRLDLADGAQAKVEAFAGADAPAWAGALLARCRAMRATGEEAEQAYGEALRLHGDGARPLDWARTELLFGEFLRRERRRVEAREHLRAALERFERLGATPWAERARAELRASGETARKRDPSTLLQLTPQELQVARFVAEGLSNKEVAAQLFLSPRTVDAHLRNVFSKLGITSRTQLARLDLEPDAGAAQPALA